MTSADSQSSSEELVYAPAVVILSSELYPRKLEIVREYIQNASDAIDIFARVAEHLDDSETRQIKISIHGRSLLIWDSGIGMDAEEMKKLRRIAYSEKRIGEGAGYKGIGRLAGIAVAQKLIITSTSYGDSKLHKFEFRAGDFLADIEEKRKEGVQETATAVINRHTDLSEFEVDESEHYTLVELRDIDDRYPELLDPKALSEYIADIGPVGFAPDFTYGEYVAKKLCENLPDWSPKSVSLTIGESERVQIYKPYENAMLLAEPEFIELYDSSQKLIAFCWYAAKGREMVGKVRPSGGKFVVDGKNPTEKKRLAGLVYKLFGFSIGDRTLPLRTLWKKDYTRALWFTGEIHIVDKSIKPTTDRSDFVENEARSRLYAEGEKWVAKKLNQKAQEISDNRKAHDRAEEFRERFDRFEDRIGRGIERAEIKAIKEEIYESVEEARNLRNCKDSEIREFVVEVSRRGAALQARIEEAKGRRAAAIEVNDLVKEIGLTSQARKVYQIIMEVLEYNFREERDVYYDLSSQISNALKKKY